jgi:hypothetical protein
MRYVAVDELHHFNFHDARIKTIDWHGKDFVWQVDGINATTENSQNSCPKHMCIDSAEAVLKDARIESIVFGAYETRNSYGILIDSAEDRLASSYEYDEVLEKTMLHHCDILAVEKFTKAEDGRFSACFKVDGFMGDMSVYDITMSFSKSIVSWSEFSGEAWYEHPK